MSQIQELPHDMNAGLEFNYSVWSPGTVVQLCTVPWNSDYRDVVRFDDQAALDTYLNTNSGPKITLTGLMYANPGDPIRIQLPLNTVYKYNYLRVFNPAQPIIGDEPKSFYYFLNEPRRLAPDTTQLNIQLDVFQTFGYGVTFGNCYVERGHIGIANQDNFADYGREFLTVPEGLDVGGEYQIEKQWVQQVAHARDNDIDDANGFYDIMVISATNLAITDPGTVDHPNLETGPGSRWENLPNGATIYLFNKVQFLNFLAEFKSKPWITQGIMSITAVPPNGIYFSGGTNVDIGETAFATIPDPTSLNRRKTPMAPAWRDTVDLGRYANLKKFLTYPYCVMELTSYTGNPLMLKPESWNDPNAHVMELPHFAPPNPRLAFYPYRYNASGVPETVDEMGVLNDGGEFLDMQTGIMNFPAFSIVNEGGIAYLAANANSIAYQHSSADWGQQRAQQAAMTAYGQANSGIGTSQDVNKIGINAQRQQTNLANETAGYNAIAGGVTGLIGSAARKDALGGVTGAAGTAANYAIGVNQNNQSMGISTNASSLSNAAINKNAGYVRDSNRDYAEFANKGDYENNIAGIQSKIQDAKLIQPTTAGQVGGDAFLLALYKWGYDLKLKMVGGAAMNAIGEYWLRYGYQCNRFTSMPANFMVMENFTYWKLKETYITGANCPENFKQAMRGIFEKGVTVWSNPEHIGTLDMADNQPLEGISL
jgi:hypothetical protein